MLSTNSVEGLSRLIAEVFRLNGQLLAAGDELVRAVGLTSARWQVLGSVCKAEAPATVSQVARDRGLTRQAVQRIVNDLVRAELLSTSENPRHRRAYLLSPTTEGRRVHEAADALALPWLTALAADTAPESLNRSAEMLARITDRLQSGRAAYPGRTEEALR